MSSIHPNVYPASQKWSEEQTLHIAVAHINPFRWRTRRELTNDFRSYISKQPNIVLHLGELAYGDRPFEVTGSDPNDVKLRTNSELFHKENVLNEVIKTFPPDWKYGAYIDADFTFTRQDLGLETIHQLQHHHWVQMFSNYLNLPPKGYGSEAKGGSPYNGIVFNYIQNGYSLPESLNPWGWGSSAYYDSASQTNAAFTVGATGGAFAFTRTGFETTGGLLEQCILGHADWFMSFGLLAKTPPSVSSKMDWSGRRVSKYHPHYVAMINSWQRRAYSLRQNIGYVDSFAVHHFHGSKANRKYCTRDQILVKYQFDPIYDIKKNAQGIYELAGNKPGLRDAIRQYFINRSEDDTTGQA